MDMYFLCLCHDGIKSVSNLCQMYIKCYMNAIRILYECYVYRIYIALLQDIYNLLHRCVIDLL